MELDTSDCLVTLARTGRLLGLTIRLIAAAESAGEGKMERIFLDEASRTVTLRGTQAPRHSSGPHQSGQKPRRRYRR